MKKALIAIGLLAMLASPALAQLTPSSSVVKFKAVEPKEKYNPGDSFRLLFELKFKDGWHGQSHNPTMEGLIATSLKLTGEKGIGIGRIAYPKGEMEKFAFAEELLSTYKGTTYLGATVALPPDIKPDEYNLEATLTIQSCDDVACLMPSDMAITIPIKVVPDGEPTPLSNQDIFKSTESLFEEISVNSEFGGMPAIGDYLSDNGLLLTFILVFLGGLALNLTPCVYPLIPITVSYFGGQSESKKGKLVLNAVIYLLGMAVMYSSLGLFAALTGSMFGDLLRHPGAIMVVALILVALALSMFGLYEIRPPAALSQIGGKNREGLFGTFMMGLTVGIIAAPCIGPFVVGLLAYVGEKGDPLLGFSMFFVLALGLGLPFLFLAIFSGAISVIPSSGMWMVWVKQVFGVILLGMALYFLEALIPENIYHYILGIFLVAGGIYLGWITKAQTHGSGFRMVRSIVGIVFVGVGLFFIAPSQANLGPRIDWQEASREKMAASMSSGKPVIMDFSADWCLPCKELDHFTFADQRVVEYSEKIDMLFADLTTSGNAEVEALKKKFGVLGVPTVIFLDSKGNERSDLRFVGFVDADDFLDRMKKLTN
ncbi:Cytochrome c-type biogenesis protein DsbD, protein-disulfide reductase [hydrothermal vent metagenome]|uniref:Cytochrome c-type biogenesis protein DsbD, protein-disulfide reductase n=1 Tax=hydrothermal vent metagenome TaxID=652676 RepID=A0A3B1CA67_9ZZZZ